MNTIYVDSTVREAHETITGAPISRELLGELSQVHRSSDAANIFKEITGIEVGSKSGLVALFQRVKSGDYNLQAALREDRLQKYVKRTEIAYLD